MPDAYATLVREFLSDVDVGWSFEIKASYQRLNDYISNHPHEFPNTCLRLVHEDIDFDIPINTSNQEVVTAAVCGVSECGFADLLTQLMPHWSEPRDDIIKYVADAGHVECAAILLTVCSALDDNSRGLQNACINDDTEMFNVLLPVSDPHAAWAALHKHPSLIISIGKQECFARLESIVQRQTLGQHVGLMGKHNQRKM